MKVTCWVVPIEKEKVAAFREFGARLDGALRAQYIDCQRRTGATREICFLWETEERAYCLLYLQGEDIRSIMEAFQTSDNPFDSWFLEQLGSYSDGWPDPGWGTYPTPGVAELLSVYDRDDESLDAKGAQR